MKSWKELIAPDGAIYTILMDGTPEGREEAISTLYGIAELADRYNSLSSDNKKTIDDILLGKHKPIVSAVKVAKKVTSKQPDMFKHILSIACKSQSIPACEYVKITTEGYAVADNLEVRVGFKLPNYKADQDVMVPGNLLKGMKPEDILGCTVDKVTFAGLLKTTKGDVKFSSCNPEEFPGTPTQDNCYNAVFTKEMVELIKCTSKYCGNDDLRPVMSGVYVTDKNIVGTDAHLLQWHNVTTDIKEGIIIPSKYTKYLIEGVGVINQTHLGIIADNSFVTLRLIDGKYPNWEAVLPTKNPLKLVIDRDKMITNLEMLSKVWNTSTHMVAIDTDMQTMRSEDLDWNREMELALPVINKQSIADEPYEKDGKIITPEPPAFIRIGFNGNFLLRTLKERKDATFTMDISQPNRAGIIDGNVLVMPIKLDM